ncbi:heavy metal translocating P-type ATPase [Vulcanococcus sp. Clear-D1]|uniref:heavy metal translocating P-type ATPase n=1 Tax=Vulcanococcus sp. Clear-D1 TaxID=2766970 RepID=UPI0025D6FB92|nr:heavy metal translocating P-type ATPase [Vulcanococcus sp. Clear-D1]
MVPVSRNSSSTERDGTAQDYSVEQVLHHSARRVRFRVGGSAASWPKLEQALSQAAEVKHVRLNPVAGCCVVEFDRGAAVDPLQWLQQLPGALPALQRLAEAPTTTRPEAKPQEGEADDESFVPSRIILPVSSLALALLAGPLALPPLAVAAFILVSAHLSFKRAWQGLKEERKINVDFLDALAVTLHSLEGFLVGPAMMITMIEGGEAVRDATQRIAHSANTDLLASLQTDVRLLVDGTEVIVPSTSLQAGDRIALFPGDQIPVDGRIEIGEGSLDVVKLTGESVPRHASPGDEVLAGFILLEGNLVVETQAVGEATRVGQITAMIESAPVYDTRVGNVAGKVANRFVLPTLALAGLSLLLSGGNIAQAASLLMFDLGTGLRVSVPTAIMAALTRAGSQGLLIRSGRSLEQLVDIDVVVFDKTGTLTQGHPSVVHVEVVAGAHSINKLVQLAASAEQGLNHPVAEAIVKHAEALGVSAEECEAWDYRIGRGVAATIQGHQVLVGNAKLLREEKLEPATPSVDPELETATPVYLAVDGTVVAVIYAADALRPDSQAMVAELHRRGIQAHMLTGDVSSVAHAVAKRLGLRPEEVHADALPDEKAKLVQELSQQGHKVAFVGDGINDSAALAYADVSISFASGSDLARETADIVLTNDKVSDLIVAQDLARETFGLVKQNIGIVGVPNLSALLLGTFLPVSPIAAVVLNNGSALVAAANAMRVLGFKGKQLASAAPGEPATAAGEPIARPPAAAMQEEQEAISLSALSKRLGVAHQSITARRKRGDFGPWIQSLDPAGYAWSYCDRSNTYRRAIA